MVNSTATVSAASYAANCLPASGGNNIAPMDINEIRYRRFMELLGRYKTQTDFARQAGLVAPHVSQIVKKRRGIGEGVARRVEKSFKLPFGALDQPAQDEKLDTPIEEFRPNRPLPGHTLISEAREEEREVLIADLRERVDKCGGDSERVTRWWRPEITPLGQVNFDAVILGKTTDWAIDFMRPSSPSLLVDRVAGQRLRINSLDKRPSYAVILTAEPPMKNRTEDTLCVLCEMGIIQGFAAIYDTDEDFTAYDELIQQILEDA